MNHQLSFDAAAPAALRGHLSPFRYPGGKSWMASRAAAWLRRLDTGTLLEPFAGGASVSLAALAEQAVDHAHLVELDERVAAVWGTILTSDWRRLVHRIQTLSVENELRSPTPTSRTELAVQTIIKNRVARGGVLAAGAGMQRQGENGQGITSRWYPTTLASRITYIAEDLASRMTFTHGNAFDALTGDDTSGVFADPPYTTSPHSPGARLYDHHVVDHNRLLDLLRSRTGPFLCTYNDDGDTRTLLDRHGIQYAPVAMRTSHHTHRHELVASSHLSAFI